MPQPSPPPNRFAMLQKDGLPSRSWAEWLTSIRDTLVPKRAFYIPTSAGIPTFAPETRTGFVALCYDTVNDDLYVYNNAWKKVTLA